MPVSKARRARNRPKKRASKRRDNAAEARARITQVARQQAEKQKTLTPAACDGSSVGPWSPLGVVAGAQHLIHHMGFFTLVSPGVDDLIAGYPLAGNPRRRRSDRARRRDAAEMNRANRDAAAQARWTVRYDAL